jgi:hypothetical protein
MGRIKQAGVEQWITVTMPRLLKEEKSAPWSLDVSKQYFLSAKEHVLYGWRIIIQAPGVVEHLPAIGNLVQESRALTPSGQLTEVSLHANPNRHAKYAKPVRG